MNEENLIPLNQRSKEAAKEIQTAGGIARGEQQRKKKEGRELIRYILSLQEKDPRIIAEMQKAGINEDEMTKTAAMAVRLSEKAIKTADVRAFTALMKAAGYDTEGTIPEGVTIIVKTQDDARRLEQLKDLDI